MAILQQRCPKAGIIGGPGKFRGLEFRDGVYKGQGGEGDGHTSLGRGERDYKTAREECFRKCNSLGVTACENCDLGVYNNSHTNSRNPVQSPPLSGVFLYEP